MIKGKNVRIYYPVLQASTGQRVTQDASNHTIYVSNGAELVKLTLTPTELYYGTGASTVYTGEYTFELAADYTNSDIVSIIIQSSNSNVDAVIPPIELKFDDPKTALTDDSIDDIVDNVWGATVTAATDSSTLVTVGNILYDLKATNTKVSTYPTYNNFTVDSVDKDEIAKAVLTCNITDTMCTNTYTLAGSIMGGFYSNMDADNNIWTVYKPGGTTFFQREFTTDSNLKPVSDIGPRS